MIASGGATLLNEADPIGSVFAPVLGLPAWGVQKSQGSILTFEFGAPHLSIREPIAEPLTTHPGVRKRLQRRHVVPRGEWWLWIYCCHWRCLENGVLRGTDESGDPDIVAVAALLDGQKLISVAIDPSSGGSTFVFDLGAMLETWPYQACDTDEQWALHTPSEHALSYRGDGCYSWAASSQTPEQEHWVPLSRAG